jgi:DNA helicase-4
LEKLPKRELEKKVVRNQVDRMTELFVQFIQKAKKQMWSVSEMKDKIRELQSQDKRVMEFLNLAIRVYGNYQEELKSQAALDFDDLLLEASKRIELSKGEDGISLGLHKDRYLRMRDLEWILIDEFQDFSLLFYNLIEKIRKFNPEVNLLCVGDDWQAINAFAGSDLIYFHEVENYLPNTQITTLQTNFRSQKVIVDAGNKLMNGLGKKGESLPNKKGGEVKAYTIDQVWIERREEEEFKKNRKSDKKFIFLEQRADGPKMHDNGYLQAKYLKACYKIISAPRIFRLICEKRRKGKDDVRVAILSRTNYLYRISLDDFLHKLRSCFTYRQLKDMGNFNQKIRISTVHGFKGLEADIVIVVRVCEGVFPLIHPDSSLYSIFGENELNTLAEERRLFYVAMTRAKDRLYLLTEEERESDFLDQAGVHVKSWSEYRSK